MTKSKSGNKKIIRDLGDGLILRRGIVDDIDKLALYISTICDSGEFIRHWAMVLLTGVHPTCSVKDFTVVEDTHDGDIVSSMGLISQTWSYEGIKFGVGRPEAVWTKPEYRNRGLIRAQFDVIHEWSAQRGEKVQFITGIPNFYRQFGYEFAIEYSGGRSGSVSNVPQLKEGEKEPCQIRLATESDLPFIRKVYGEQSQRSLVTCIYDEAQWRFQLHLDRGRDEFSDEMCLIESAAGKPVGFFMHPKRIENTAVAYCYMLKQGVDWQAITPSVMRYLQKKATELAKGDQKECRIGFWGTDEPVHQIAKDMLPRVDAPWSIYIRVADLVGFLQHIMPVLEKRLGESLLVGHSGELKVSMYHSGFKLLIHEGKITAENWQPTPDDKGHAGFPDLTFLKVLFGSRTPEEIHYILPDCWVRGDEARMLLQILFPKKPSSIWALGG